MSKTITVCIPPADSLTIKNDLSARGLTSMQIEKVMEWLVQQQNISYISRIEIERYFQQEGFSQKESTAVVITLVKEGVRPKIRISIALAGLGLLVLIAFLVCYRVTGI